MTAALPRAGLAAGAFFAGLAVAAIAIRLGDAAPVAFVAVGAAALLAVAVFQYPPLAVLVVVATFPIGSLVVPGLPSWLQPVEAAALAMAALVAFRRLAVGRPPLAWSSTLWWAVALFGTMLVALPSALDPGAALKQIATLVGGLVFACLVLAVCRSGRDVEVVAGGIVVVAVVLALHALAGVEAFRATAAGGVVEGRLRGVFAHPNELGSVCAIGALLAGGLMLGAGSRRARVAAALAAVPLVAALTLSFSRGTWIGFALGVLFLVAVLPSARRLAVQLAVPLAVAVLAVGVLALGSAQVEVVGERLRSFTNARANPEEGRPAIWREALREIQEDPVTGHGPGSFPVASTRAESEAVTIHAEHAHNIWLTWGAEVGLPAVLVILGLIAAVARAGRETLRRAGHAGERALAAGIAAALVSMLGNGLVNYSLRNSVLFLTLWGLVGALLALRRYCASDFRAA